MKEEFLTFQSTFLSTCEGKTSEQLWQKFKDEADMLINRYVPTKTIRGRKKLRMITREIRRNMNKRDNLYQVQKSSGKDADRLQFRR